MATYLLVSLLFIVIPTPFLNLKFIFASSIYYELLIEVYIILMIFNFHVYLIITCMVLEEIIKILGHGKFKQSAK